MKLFDLVSEAYENAIFNGYNMKLLTDEEVAEDMWNYDADIAEFPLEDVIKAVKEFRKE